MTSPETPSRVDPARIDLVRAAVLSLVRGHQVDADSAGGERARIMVVPFWPLGYPMTGELIALERLAVGVGSQTAAEQAPEGGEATGDHHGITKEDEQLSQVTAFLFDHLVNLILPSGPTAPRPDESVPLNEPYERVLRSAEFAGADHPESAELTAADAVLFRTDEHGDRRPSRAYAQYQDFQNRVRQARTRLNGLDPDATDSDQETARDRLDQLQADWLLRGHKREIEAAIDTVLRESRASGFEDERARLLARFTAQQVKRLDAIGRSYLESELVPLAPLLQQSTQSAGWRQIELTADDVAATVTADAAAAAGLSMSDFAAGVAGLRRLSLELLSVDVVRDWLDPGFFTARYWRLPAGRHLSDGHGGGDLPGYASRLYFVRGVVADYADGLSVDTGRAAHGPEQIRSVRVEAEQSPVAMNARRALDVAAHAGLPRARTMLEARSAEERVRPARVVRRTVAARRRSPRVSQISRVRSTAGARAARRLNRRRIRVTAASAGSARPRRHVRDHRTGDRPVVRDHRTGRAGRPVDQEVRVRVHLSGEPGLLDGLAVRLTTGQGQGRQIMLQPDRSGGVSGETRLTVARRHGQERVSLRSAVDGEIANADVALDRDDVMLGWQVNQRVVSVQVTGPNTPTLFGYAVTPVPACPNPDPDLAWP